MLTDFNDAALVLRRWALGIEARHRLYPTCLSMNVFRNGDRLRVRTALEQNVSWAVHAPNYGSAR